LQALGSQNFRYLDLDGEISFNRSATWGFHGQVEVAISRIGALLILMPVPIVPAVQSLRFVQDVNCAGTTRRKLALVYWICRRSDKRQERGRKKAMIVIRDRGELSRFDNSQNVEMSAVIAFRSERLPAVKKMIRPLAVAVFLPGLRRV